MSTTQIVPVREIAVAVSDASSATAVMPSTSGTQWNNIVKDKAVTKQMPGLLCACPQLCHEKFSHEMRLRILKWFDSLSDETEKQNQLLQSNMKILPNRNSILRMQNGELQMKPKRVLCRYYLPNLDDNKRIEVCQKAFMNAFVISTKRVRMQREKLIELNRLENSIEKQTRSPTANATNSMQSFNYDLQNRQQQQQQQQQQQPRPRQRSPFQGSKPSKPTTITYEMLYEQYSVLKVGSNFVRLCQFLDNQLWDFSLIQNPTPLFRVQ